MRYNTVDALIQIAMNLEDAGMPLRHAVHRASTHASHDLVARMGSQQIALRITVALVERAARAAAMARSAWAIVYE